MSNLPDLELIQCNRCGIVRETGEDDLPKGWTRDKWIVLCGKHKLFLYTIVRDNDGTTTPVDLSRRLTAHLAEQVQIQNDDDHDEKQVRAIDYVNHEALIRDYIARTGSAAKSLGPNGKRKIVLIEEITK